jgi:hypothetical protein
MSNTGSNKLLDQTVGCMCILCGSVQANPHLISITSRREASFLPFGGLPPE